MTDQQQDINAEVTKMAMLIAQEMDRRSLLHDSNGVLPLNTEQLQPHIEAIAYVLRSEVVKALGFSKIAKGDDQ